MRQLLRGLASEREAWAGLPMPLDTLPLVVEPGYPNAEKLMAIGRKQEDDKPAGERLRNVFYSRKWRCRIVVYSEAGRVRHGKIPAIHGFDQQIASLGAMDAWGLEQETRALQTLSELVRPRHFKQYVLTGSFLERSRRSGLTYMFRRLRPTVALTFRGGETRILCALCLHPIAYYDGSWAGAMCPTDDVIAHLMLMRGDEPMFWRRANQHGPGTPEAGL